MRVLLDECLPRKLRNGLAGHEVSTVPEMGWNGLENGKLLRLAEGAFDVFVTIDQGLRYQQNLQRARMGVILLNASSNRIETLRLLVPKVLDALRTIKRGEIVRISE